MHLVKFFVCFPIFCFLLNFKNIFSQDFNVKDFNATGDGKADDTNAVRAAFNAAAKNGGGRVIFDEGYVFLTGCFNVTSNIILDIRGVILASNSSNDYVAVQPLPWYGGGPDAQMTGMPEWQSVIRSYYAKNITITGGGLIDGQGQAWWNCSKQLWESPCNWLSRPPLIRLIHTTDIVIENIYLKDSPIWTLHLANTTNVYINNINITAPWYSLNTDGIDIDCSVNVLVNNSYYSGGDDAIAIKSGIDLLGREYGRTSENITVQNMIVGAAGGLSIGSEMSGGVRNVTFQNISMDSSYRGVFIKSQRGRGGIVQDINYINITLNNVNAAIYITMNYSEKYIPPMGEDATPKFKNITITNFLSNQATFGWNIDGLDESVIQNVYFSNIKIMNTASSNLFIKCDNIYGTCDNTSVLPYCPKCIHKEEECFDTSNDCSQYINVCNNPAYHAIMCSNCRKSCNLCESC